MKKVLLLTFISSAICQQAVSSDDIDTLIYQNYKEYVAASQDYMNVLNESSSHIRTWRKKKLLEIFDERLETLERNLILSNTGLIEEFNKFVEDNGVQSLDDALLIRLAQLYFEKSNIDYSLQMKKYQSDVELQSAGKISELTDPPQPDFSKTLKFAKIHLDNFPKSSLKDKALYLIGYCNEEVRKTESAILAYKQLINEIPNSEYSEEVQWRLAEIYYSQKIYNLALSGYMELARIKGDFYIKALYKQGAVYFDQKLYSSASEIFEKIIKELDKEKTLSTENQIIQEEAIEYLASIFTQDQSIKISENIFPEILYRLGQMYKKKLDESSMVETYIYASKRYPMSYRMPEMFVEVIEKYESDDDIENANYYRNIMIQNLTQNSKWWLVNDKYRDIVFQAQDTLELGLLKSAEYYADKGYRSNNLDQLKIARDRYFNFTAKYPWSPYADRAKLELADIEYFVQNYEKSSQYYFEIVNETSSPSIREEAAYSLIWSEIKKVKYDLNFEDKNFNPSTVVKVPFTRQESIFVQSALFYISKIKYSSRRNRVLYKMAEMYLEHADFEASASYLNLIISDSLNTNLVTIKAFRLLNEIYNIKGDWKSLSVVQELARSMNFYVDINTLDTNNLLQKNLEKLEAAVNYEFEGKYQAAAVEYEKNYLDSKNAALNELLVAKIANLYLKTGDFLKAEGYIAKLTGSIYKAEANFLKAQLLFKQAAFDESVVAFENFIYKYPRHIWYNEAYLNIISIRSQLKQPGKIADFFSKNKPLESSTHLYYEYWDSLLKSQKYNDILKSIGQIKESNNYDYYRLQSYLLQSYASKDDYANFGRRCEAIKTNLSNAKFKTAYSTFSESFCEYYDLRKMITKSDITIDDVVAKLNKIYSYKVESVTLRALNDVSTLSELKTTNKEQIIQLATKGWVLARQSPLSIETYEFSKNILNYFNMFPLSLSYMMNWNISLSDMFDFKNVADSKGKWREIKLSCETKNYTTCLKEMKVLSKSEYNEDLSINIIIAAMKLGDDKEINQGLKSFIERSNYSENSKVYAYLLGLPILLPEDKRVIDFNPMDPLSLASKALEFYENNNVKLSLDMLKKTIVQFPQSPIPYFILAQIYFEKGFPELSRTVVLNGFEASQSKSLLSILYQLNAVTFSNTQVSMDDIIIETSPAELFGLGYAAVKNNDLKTLNKIYSSLKTYKNWFDMTKSMELLYLNPQNFRSDINENNNYVLWLTKLYALSRSQSVVDLENLKRLADYGIRNPSLREIEKVLIVRDIAGEEK